eukprot:1978097-Pleurochrysis_carterae.AAC.1
MAHVARIVLLEPTRTVPVLLAPKILVTALVTGKHYTLLAPFDVHQQQLCPKFSEMLQSLCGHADSKKQVQDVRLEHKVDAKKEGTNFTPAPRAAGTGYKQDTSETQRKTGTMDNKHSPTKSKLNL